MDNTNATDTDTAKPKGVEPSVPNNEDDDVSSRLSPLIENKLNPVESTSTTESIDPKIDNQITEAETKSTEQTNSMEVRHQEMAAMITVLEEPPDDPGETSLKLMEDIDPNDQESVEKIDTTSEIKSATDEANNESLIEDSEDLLVPTDFVPDSADVISDEPKRKHSHCEMTSEMCKKFKHDPSVDDDISMQTESTEDELGEMCAESNDVPLQASPDKPTVTNNEIPEKSETANEELNITDILTKGIGCEKTIALADIIESVDDLIKKDDEQSETNNSGLVEEKQIEETCSKQIDDVTEKNSDLVNATVEDLDFNISEKLKEMGEISLAPVSKTDRKPLPDFDLGAEVSLEQISKKSADGDDKRNKVSNLRKNIREVMDDNQLDASTLAAQREELERLARVQEQQRMIREMQRQVALDRQNSKTQSKVLSLLTGHTSLLKSSSAGASSKAQATSPTISGGDDAEDVLSSKSGDLTPSVSIAPIKTTQKKSESIEISDVSAGLGMHNEADTDSNEKLEKSTDELLIIEDEEELTEEEEDDEDDDVIELKPKKDIVTIDDSSDDDCIM